MLYCYTLRKKERVLGGFIVLKIMSILFIVSSLLFSAVDINTATFDELVSLKGIGKKKAKRILKYRKKHGCFHSFKEFRKVKGIKKKTIKKNKGNIIVGECKQPQNSQNVTVEKRVKE